MSVYSEIVTAIVDTIQELELDSIGPSDIAVRKFPWDQNQVYRGITVQPIEERVGGGTNESDRIGYRVAVTIVMGSSGNRSYVDRTLDNRQTIREKFHNKRIAAVQQVCVCRVSFSDVFLPKQFQANYDASGLIITAWTDENRPD